MFALVVFTEPAVKAKCPQRYLGCLFVAFFTGATDDKRKKNVDLAQGGRDSLSEAVDQLRISRASLFLLCISFLW